MIEYKFQCPSCQQRIAVPEYPFGQTLFCPTCGHKLLFAKKSERAAWVTFFMIAGLAVLIWGWKEKQVYDALVQQDATAHEIDPERFEDTNHTLWRWKDEASASMLTECSNRVGFVRVLHSWVIDQGPKPELWDADATVDYVNAVGGIQRTDLIFKVFIFNQHAGAVLDDSAMASRDEKEAARMAAYMAHYK